MGDVRLRAGAVEWRQVEGEIVALDLDSSEYLAINRSGTAIWPLLADGATREDLAIHLAQEYGIERSAAEHDVGAFLDVLSERGLLE